MVRNPWTGVLKKPSLSVIVRDAEEECCYTILSLSSFNWFISRAPTLVLPRVWVQNHVFTYLWTFPVAFGAWSDFSWLNEMGKALEKERGKCWDPAVHRYSVPWRMLWIFTKIRVYTIYIPVDVCKTDLKGMSLQTHAVWGSILGMVSDVWKNRKLNQNQHSVILKGHTFLLAQYPNLPRLPASLFLPPTSCSCPGTEPAGTQAQPGGWHRRQGRLWRRNEALVPVQLPMPAWCMMKWGGSSPALASYSWWVSSFQGVSGV